MPDLGSGSSFRAAARSGCATYAPRIFRMFVEVRGRPLINFSILEMKKNDGEHVCYPVPPHF